MKEFRLPSKPLKPNPFFMDIYKKDMTKHIEKHQRERNLFSLYSDYLRKVTSVFSDCPPEHQFWLDGGRGLKNLKELYEELLVMDDNVYAKHTTHGKNDFAEWVRHVFKDEKLAIALGLSQTRVEAIEAIHKRAEELISESKQVTKIDEVFSNVALRLKEKNSKLEEEIRKRKEWLIEKHRELEQRERRALEKERELEEKFRQLEKQEAELKEKIASQMDKIHMYKEEARQYETAKVETLEQIYNELDSLIIMSRNHVQLRQFVQARNLVPKIRHYYMLLEKTDPRRHEFWVKISDLKKHIDEALSQK
ncbi:MAG: hypothetical protein QXK37_04225 [Candidatus Woesearchaeota archaeon]